MAFKYESVVPWGRSFEEYREMFALTDGDLQSSILGCGDGPASFNFTMKTMENPMVSIDPIYQMSAEEIKQRIDETYEYVIAQTRDNQDKFIWTNIKSVDHLGEIRMKAMTQFLADYDLGKQEGRYLPGELPHLPLEPASFDLALCSHFLFLYTDNLTLEFHIEAIEEMLRVAGEIRIFPLLDVNACRSPYVDEIKNLYLQKGYRVEELEVHYEFQTGGNRMLKIKELTE